MEAFQALCKSFPLSSRLGREIEPKIAKKILFNFNKNCLPELQWWFFRVLNGFLADLLAFHLITIPLFALSFNCLPRLSTRGESPAGCLTESGHKILHIGSQQWTIALRVCKKFESDAWSLKFLARMRLTRQSLNNACSAMQQLEAGSGWNAKGQGTSGVASKRKQGPDGGIGAWTVAMEIEGKPTR